MQTPIFGKMAIVEINKVLRLVAEPHLIYVCHRPQDRRLRFAL